MRLIARGNSGVCSNCGTDKPCDLYLLDSDYLDDGAARLICKFGDGEILICLGCLDHWQPNDLTIFVPPEYVNPFDELGEE